MCEWLTWPWPRWMLTWPTIVRIFFYGITFCGCVCCYLLTHTTVESAGLLSIPIAVGGWNFKQAGACSAFFGTLGLLLVYNLLSFRSVYWPASVWVSLLILTITMMLLGAAVVSLRKIIDREGEARQLAEENKRRTAVMYEKARQLDQVKNQFIQNINHELRTPLMAAYGYFEYVQLLLEKRGNAENALHAECIKNALHYCEELCTLVNNVLETMEVGNDSRPLALKPVPLAEVFKAVFSNIDTFRHEQQRTHLEVPGHLNVWAQDQCLRHVLYNLLSNAYKYSPADTPVSIYTLYSGKDKQYIYICVQDRGPGIPPEEIPTIFERFTRLPGDIGGTVRGVGLGLYISRHLIEVMHGHIWAESSGSPGEGSRFYIALPNADYPSPEVSAASPVLVTSSV